MANKCDRETERKVQKLKAESWCQNNGNYRYFETSAKDDISVNEAFEAITTLASEQVKEEEIYIPSTIKLNDPNKKPAGNSSQQCSC